MNTPLAPVWLSATAIGGLYDQIADSYAKANAEQNTVLRDATIRFCSKLPKNGRILDLGCASGRDAAKFSGMGFIVVGVDPSAKLLKLAERSANCQFVPTGFLEFKCVPEEFDGVWASASLLHFPGRELNSVLRKIHRLLKPAGTFFATFKEGAGRVMEIDKYDGKVMLPVTRHSLDKLVARYQSTGFRVVQKKCKAGWVQILASRIG